MPKCTQDKIDFGHFGRRVIQAGRFMGSAQGSFNYACLLSGKMKPESLPREPTWPSQIGNHDPR